MQRRQVTACRWLSRRKTRPRHAPAGLQRGACHIRHHWPRGAARPGVARVVREPAVMAAVQWVAKSKVQCTQTPPCLDRDNGRLADTETQHTWAAAVHISAPACMPGMHARVLETHGINVLAGLQHMGGTASSCAACAATRAARNGCPCHKRHRPNKHHHHGHHSRKQGLETPATFSCVLLGYCAQRPGTCTWQQGSNKWGWAAVCLCGTSPPRSGVRSRRALRGIDEEDE